MTSVADEPAPDDGPDATTSLPLGAHDGLDIALLGLHRLTLGATIRAGNATTPQLTATQIRLLTLLSTAPEGLTLSAIAGALMVSAPSASRLCQRMVRDELVSRQAGPGHYIIVTLTEAGAAVLQEANRLRLAPLRTLLEELPKARRAEVVRLLDELGRRAARREDTW